MKILLYGIRLYLHTVLYISNQQFFGGTKFENDFEKERFYRTLKAFSSGTAQS